MSTARAIQVSVTHVSLGIMAGAAIEGFMPAYTASASSGALMFEAFVQIALNGVLLAQMGGTLTSDDPTFGLPFSLGLFEAQPALRKRIETLAAVAKQQVAQTAQKMASPVAAEA